jgi:hypothetical protein
MAAMLITSCGTVSDVVTKSVRGAVSVDVYRSRGSMDESRYRSVIRCVFGDLLVYFEKTNDRLAGIPTSTPKSDY